LHPQSYHPCPDARPFPRDCDESCYRRPREYLTSMGKSNEWSEEQRAGMGKDIAGVNPLNVPSVELLQPFDEDCLLVMCPHTTYHVQLQTSNITISQTQDSIKTILPQYLYSNSNLPTLLNFSSHSPPFHPQPPSHHTVSQSKAVAKQSKCNARREPNSLTKEPPHNISTSRKQDQACWICTKALRALGKKQIAPTRYFSQNPTPSQGDGNEKEKKMN